MASHPNPVNDFRPILAGQRCGGRATHDVEVQRPREFSTLQVMTSQIVSGVKFAPAFWLFTHSGTNGYRSTWGANLSGVEPNPPIRKNRPTTV